jgi:hypothetical protein
VLLAGLHVPNGLVRELVEYLHFAGVTETAERLRDAHSNGRGIVALTADDREAILRALQFCPYGLRELQSVLLLERHWRITEGLAGRTPHASWRERPARLPISFSKTGE